MRTKLNLVKEATVKETAGLEQLVTQLEEVGGDLDRFMEHSNTPGIKEQLFFRIEQRLSKPENAELKERWHNALKLSAKIRMDLLRCKAFNLLENYTNASPTSSASDIAFAKTVLVGILVEDSEMVKSKYRPTTQQGIITNE